jgi:hypothetical protein
MYVCRDLMFVCILGRQNGVCVAERHDIVLQLCCRRHDIVLQLCCRRHDIVRIKVSCVLQKGTILCKFTLGSQNIVYFVGRQNIVRIIERQNSVKEYCAEYYIVCINTQTAYVTLFFCLLRRRTGVSQCAVQPADRVAQSL